MAKLRVRILLRVSSTGQLDPDGDLDIQRKIVLNYVKEHEKDDWYYDETDSKSEYFEGGVSGFKNSVEKREVLQLILKDAENHEFDILVCYKDDRLGRRDDEIPAYIKELFKYHVCVYTVKDGLITPTNHIEDLLSFIRYWHAEGSSRDTSQRVHDAAVEHVKQGKNMGGKAPYGYELVLSGEYSKHQRALKKKVKVPEKVEVVLHIYDLAVTYGYGAYKIAKVLNQDENYRAMSPNGKEWKSVTIWDILRNPIYTGYIAYDRRRHEGDHYRRLDRSEWTYALECNEELKIMELEYWEKVQNIREDRKAAIKSQVIQNGHTPQRTTGTLSLIDVAYCASCGRKMTNGSKYSYWTTKDGEECSSIRGYYRCQSKQQGESCEGVTFVRADELEEVVYSFIKDYLNQLQDNTLVLEKLEETRKAEMAANMRECDSLRRKIDKCDEDIETLKESLPRVLRGEIPLSVGLLNEQLAKRESDKLELSNELSNLERKLSTESQGTVDTKEFLAMLPTWRETFDNTDVAAKRMIINKLVDRIDVSKDNVTVKLKINMDEFLPRITDGFPTIR